jgi:SAM-dependent methyltransferase
LGKTLFGFLPDDTLDFHTKLNQVYEAWNFSKYEANQNAQQFDIDLLESHIGKVDKEASLIVDLGSGTGRLANQLAFKFPGKKIVGIEASVENIMKAEKEAGELGITGKVEYLAEDWKQPDVLHGRKADIVYSLGRSLTHAESHEDLDKTLASIVDMLNMGGVFIFDLPDPNVGVVLKRRREIANKMRSLGIPIAEIPIPDRPGETMPESDIIVDSPDGRNFYNRRVPQLAEIARMLKFHGLSFEVIAREPIVGAGYLADDRNIYIRAKKIEKGTLESLRESRAFLKMIVNQQGPLPKPGSKVPSLSGQSPDGEL